VPQIFAGDIFAKIEEFSRSPLLARTVTAAVGPFQPMARGKTQVLQSSQTAQIQESTPVLGA
jgi:hypothetical protein